MTQRKSNNGSHIIHRRSQRQNKTLRI